MSRKEEGQAVALARIKPVKKRIFLTKEGSSAKGATTAMPSRAVTDDSLETSSLEQVVHLLLYFSQLTHHALSPDRLFGLKKTLAHSSISPRDFCRLLSAYLPLKTRYKALSLKKMKPGSLPLILRCHGQRWMLLKARDKNRFQVYDPVSKENHEMGVEALKDRYSGTSILIRTRKKHRTHPLDSTSQKFGTLWLLKTILRYKAVFMQVLAAAFFIQLFALVTPLFTMVIIDKVFSSSGYGTLHVLIVGLFAISFFDYLIASSRQMLLGSVTHKVDVILARSFFKRLTALPLSFFSTKQIGDAVSRVKELEVIRGFFTGSAFTLLIDFPFLLVFIGVMLLFSVKLTLIASGFILAVLLLYGVFGPFIRDRLKSKNQVQSDNNSFLIETIGGIEAIKSMSLEKKVQKRWEELLIENARHASRTEKLTGHVSQFAGFLTKSTTAVCLWIGALLVLEGELTPGQLIAFNMMVGRVIAPTQRISQLLQQLNQLKISLRRVGEIMNASPELHIREPSQLPTLEGAIRLEAVGFRYKEDGKEVLKNINLDIKAGENVALIGSTGSGKTTLLRLLQRLYLPTQGNIYIDNINVMGINPNWFREKIGVVSQENVLFNLSILQNILMAETGIEPAELEKVVDVCKLVGADQWIRRLPNAYDTVVGERGSFLSGGQRQQVSIARALLRNPRILLLDEATSALDNESEQVVEQNMERLFRGRTVIIVAHRLPRVKIMNRIIRLADGEIVENITPTGVTG